VHSIDVLKTVSNNIARLGICPVLSYSEFEDSRATLQDSLPSSPKLQPSPILSTYDFEVAAQKILSPKAWAFYSSAATDLISVKANKAFYDRVWFRPRLLRDVTTVNTSSKISGVNSNLPFFIAPCAMAKLGHKEGELGIARACHEKGIIQCVNPHISILFPLLTILTDLH
jgi:L-lactate dehydrogenase (cytochrome)